MSNITVISNSGVPPECSCMNNQCFWISIKDYLNLTNNDNRNNWTVNEIKALANGNIINGDNEQFEEDIHRNAAEAVAENLNLQFRIRYIREGELVLTDSDNQQGMETGGFLDIGSNTNPHLYIVAYGGHFELITSSTQLPTYNLTIPESIPESIPEYIPESRTITTENFKEDIKVYNTKGELVLLSELPTDEQYQIKLYNLVDIYKIKQKEGEDIQPTNFIETNALRIVNGETVLSQEEYAAKNLIEENPIDIIFSQDNAENILNELILHINIVESDTSKKFIGIISDEINIKKLLFIKDRITEKQYNFLLTNLGKDSNIIVKQTFNLSDRIKNEGSSELIITKIIDAIKQRHDELNKFIDSLTTREEKMYLIKHFISDDDFKVLGLKIIAEQRKYYNKYLKYKQKYLEFKKISLQ